MNAVLDASVALKWQFEDEETTPKGSRTPVTGLRTRRPRPLDDGGKIKSKSENQKAKLRCPALRDLFIQILAYF